MPTPPSVSQGNAPQSTDNKWLEHAQAEIQNTPARLEEVAKFLVGVVSLSFTLFISSASEDLADWTKAWFAAATVLWMIAVLLSFFVLFPWRYRFNPDSPADIERAYRRISQVKKRLLVGSLACFFVALGVAAFAFLNG